MPDNARLPASNRILLPRTDTACTPAGIRTHSTPSRDSSWPSASSPPPPPPDPSSRVLDWHISNRYYDADVQFVLFDSADELEGQKGEGEEPAVVVLARADEKPTEQVATTLSRLAARQPEFDVALLVTLSVSSPSSSDSSPSSSASPTPPPAPTPHEEAWDDLAIEHGFEWVDFSRSSPFPLAGEADGPFLPLSTPTKVAADDDEAEVEEAEGEDDPLSRLVSALQAHLWAGLTRHDPPARSSRAARPTLSDDELEDDDGDDSALPSLGLGPTLPQARPYVPLPVAFPATFLPSIPRTNASAASVSAAAQKEEEEDAFEDDFAPFVSAPYPAADSSSAPAAAFPDSAFDESSSAADYRHPSFSFPDSHSSASSLFPSSSDFSSSLLGGGLDDLDPSAELELEALDQLFAHLSARSAAERGEGEGGGEGGMGRTMDERRAFAERMVREMLGEEGLEDE
ncbi:hypothetical protein JCM8097_000667 [Rhodosporidiobolus ruineniae]